jgi:molybdopterin-containing oxidoreductase family iron-sulfur binding subunit
MSVDRRVFLKASLLATGAAAAGLATVKGVGGSRGMLGGAGRAETPALTANGELVLVPDGTAPASATAPPPDDEVRRGIPGRKWVMVIDLALCDGCGRCKDACNKMHGTPPDREWVRLYRMQDSPETAPYWFPKPCFHCDNPPCTRVCPVGATFKRQDGVVLIDNERCIGCRFCMAACPYSSRVFNWSRPAPPAEGQDTAYSPERGFPRRVGTVEKCDFCPDLARQGKLPACVESCDMGVMYFGDENEDAVTNCKGETLRLSQQLRDRAGYRYLEELGTHPRVYYLPPTDRRFPVPGGAEESGSTAVASVAGESGA